MLREKRRAGVDELCRKPFILSFKMLDPAEEALYLIRGILLRTALHDVQEFITRI